MSNVLKVEFKESFLTNNKNLEQLLSKYEFELKANNFKKIIEKETEHLRSMDTHSDTLLTLIEFMSDENIPWPLTHIPKSTFNSCSKLISVTLPDTITSIESCAFKWCIIKSIIIPNSVNYIGWSAFEKCNQLRSIIIPEGVTQIANNAFEGCFYLASVTISDSVISMGMSAFRGCGNGNLIIQTKNPYVIDYCKRYHLKCKEI